ncbi:metal-dependent hydrolase [Mangrovimonas yunxiaonensis]|uniref:Metal-dependent hydrolase n=1 Tax=Mangrovimonas yunxiaonensis TaxID=1197477 RepID=A0A084TJG0_9FLAO|nr:metal-dependent hydrolase [Mangrovimonas yunxiaonensis]KFB00846.1 metal-dependent hydrolase [Mangrovimonas yunxiaonensis]GGH44078.1 membrane protein [Mangrovimonas yunxiaonensis]
MDSLTQIVLGAAVGEVVMGKKVGNKAMLYGAIAGTIPDLDVLASHVTDTVTALEIHRGFTHSIVFCVLFAPALGWLVSKYETHKHVKDWAWLFFWAFLTHPLLDAHTTWGTQLFWPLDLRLAYKNIFVIDPLYTLPFLGCLLIAMWYKRTSKKRRFYTYLGLILSSSYLFITVILKGLAYLQFEKALTDQNITYIKMDTRPSPLNTILWNANVETKDHYLLGSYSFFDTAPMSFTAYPKNTALLGDLILHEKVKRMIAISEGWYTISENNGQLYFNDLRFGLMSLEPSSQDFVFRFLIETHPNGVVTFTEQPRNRENARQLMAALWSRIKGN